VIGRGGIDGGWKREREEKRRGREYTSRYRIFIGRCFIYSAEGRNCSPECYLFESFISFIT